MEIENANLRAERDAWARYLESKPEYNQQTPSSIINSLTKQASEAKYLEDKVQQLITEIDNRNKLVQLLEDHVSFIFHESGDVTHIFIGRRTKDYTNGKGKSKGIE